jgi:hypothetical protein
VNTTGWANNVNTIARVTSKFHAGAASCEITVYTNATSRTTVTVTSLTVGKTYTVRGWFLGAPAASRGRDTHMEIAGVVGTDFSYQIYTAAPDTWYQASITFKATSTSAVLTIVDSLPPAVTTTPHLYFDDFTITLNNPDVPPPPPSTPGVVLNLTDDDLAEAASIILSGLNQETRSIVTGQQAGGDVAFYGEAPAPAWTLNTNGPGLTTKQTTYGLLETSTTSTLADSNGATSQATQRSGMLSDTPVIIGSFVLAGRAGVTVPQLVPGTEITVKLHRSCISVEQSMILRQVNVEASPSGEKITLVMEPTADVES